LKSGALGDATADDKVDIVLAGLALGKFIGVIVGGLVVVMMIIIIICCCMRKKKNGDDVNKVKADNTPAADE